MKIRLLMLLSTLSYAYAQTAPDANDTALASASTQMTTLETHYKPLLVQTDPNYDQNRGEYFSHLADLLFPLTNDSRHITSDRATFVQSIAKEILSYPPKKAPTDQDIIGSWATPRHEYAYKGDHTWNFIQSDVPPVGGTWRIDGFTLVTKQTIMIWSLTSDTLIEKDNANLYFSSRITATTPKFRWGYRH